MRPCEEGKRCMYESFDYQENCIICEIDFDGECCPYIKLWGKHKYKKDHEGINKNE